ncbi:hypothetical protein Q8F55_002784 [Vanrija albida]|uniref:Uncharacterized protein n=1 Tax=Vanrija albida TaxID=181172 RepID=A0ABR3QBC1_9TREE
MLTILNRPSRSYKNVQHDAEGLSAVGSAPYGASSSSSTSHVGPSKPQRGEPEHQFKTYRPSYAEMHFKRQAMHDPNPSSAFSPLPPAFNIGRKHNKEKALAGQRAELDHLLEPEYKSVRNYAGGDDDAASVAGPSRLSSVRTAGGLSALSRRSKDKDENARATGSTTSFHGGQQPAGPPRRGMGGVYIDSTGRLHDTEYDPFAGVSEISRRKSRRRSAFGHQRRHSSGSSSGSEASSDSGPRQPQRVSFDGRESMDDGDREREEIRRRLEVERRRLDEVSGYAAARRRSMMSDRASGFMNGRSTPSIRSGYEDAVSLSSHAHTNGLGRAPSRLSQRHQAPSSPLSETYDEEDTRASGSSYNTTRTGQSQRATSSVGGTDESPRKHTETTPESSSTERHMRAKPSISSSFAGDDFSPQKPPAGQRTTSADTLKAESRNVSEMTLKGRQNDHQSSSLASDPLPRYEEAESAPRRLPEKVKATPMKPAQRVERAPSGATRITGFDAVPRKVSEAVSVQSVQSSVLKVPESVRSGASSRGSSEREHAVHQRQKPAERPREQLFPETPAQSKRREDRERRSARVARPTTGRIVEPIVPSSSRSRILPEIQILEDDDPRIIFPPHGPSTRIQHPRAATQTPQSPQYHSGINSGPTSLNGGERRDSSTRSITYNDSNKATSTIIEETGGGYVPSLWAGGDRHLRTTEEERERYRPKEWGGKNGDLAGRPEGWQPDLKDGFKRNVKEMSTNARFSVFRTKKKLMRNL